MGLPIWSRQQGKQKIISWRCGLEPLPVESATAHSLKLSCCQNGRGKLARVRHDMIVFVLCAGNAAGKRKSKEAATSFWMRTLTGHENAYDMEKAKYCRNIDQSTYAQNSRNMVTKQRRESTLKSMDSLMFQWWAVQGSNL